VFQNVVSVLNQIDTAKLNSTLGAPRPGCVRGQGGEDRSGHHRRRQPGFLLELNPAQ